MPVLRARPGDSRPGSIFRRLGWLGLLGVTAILLACNSILGLTSFEVIPDAADALDEQAVTEAGATCEGGQTADVDLKVVCYPCTPLVTEQLLNACTGAQCIPFDRARLTRLLPNGDLPPLPPDPDGG